LLYLAFLSVVAAAEDIPLPAYELEAVRVNEPVENPALLFSETSGFTEDDVPKSYKQYVFHLTDTDTRIDLGQETEMADDRFFPLRGMYPDSFKCEWVRPGKLLALSWHTHGVGNGHWTAGGLVLLAKLDGRWGETFRAYENGRYSGGWNSKSSALLSFEDTQGGLLLRLEEYTFYAVKEPRPLSREVKGLEETWYSVQLYRVREWPCELTNARISIGEGRVYVDLKDQRFPAREVAHALAQLWNLDPSEHEAAIDAKLKTLKELNPQLADHEEWTGRIAIGTEPPYKPDPVHRWRMQ
jgi:hypothetical protein